MGSSSKEDEAVEKQLSSKEEEPMVVQRCRDQDEASVGKQSRSSQNTTTALSGARRSDNPGLDHPGRIKQQEPPPPGLDHPGTRQEHTIARSPSEGTCSGVPARPQPLNNAVFSCANTSGPLGPPTLHNQRRGSHTQHYARARYGGHTRKKHPQPRMARDKQPKGHLPAMARSD